MKLDHERLVKLMRMTEADNDGEALNALRMANKMLKAANLHWGDVIPDPTVTERRLFEAFTHKKRETPRTYGQPLRRAHPPRTRGGRRTDEDIPGMLAALANRKHEMSFIMFLAGVSGQWRDKGYLSEDQYDAIKRAYLGKDVFR